MVPQPPSLWVRAELQGTPLIFTWGETVGFSFLNLSLSKAVYKKKRKKINVIKTFLIHGGTKK